MIKTISAFLLGLMIMTFSFGCAMLSSPSSLLKPIPGDVYISQVQPFVDSLMILYADSLNPSEKVTVENIVNSTKDQALLGKEVSILPIVVLVSSKVINKNFKLFSLTKEQAQAGLKSLNAVKSMFPDSEVIKIVDPTLRDLFNGVIEGIHPAAIIIR